MSDYKLILSGDEARAAVARGADKLAAAVVSTLGPLSPNVAINRLSPGPLIIHDGGKIARQIILKDPFEDMGAAMIAEATAKTNDNAGDGTTTATLLANTLIQEGKKLIEGNLVPGVKINTVNAVELRKALNNYIDIIIEKLDKKAKKIKTEKEYYKIAKISSASDEIAGLVTNAIAAVGKDGMVMVEDSTGFDSSVEIKEGMEIDTGYLSSTFVTDLQHMIAEYEDAYVLLTDYKIADAMLLVPIIQKVIEDNNKPLLIIVDDLVGAALKALMIINLKLHANIVVVTAPEFGDMKKQVLEDMAVLTGATLVSRELDMQLPEVQIKHLGRARTIRVTETHTNIVPANLDQQDINDRIETIKSQLAVEQNPQKRTRLENRMVRFAQKAAIINIGGGSQSEIGDKHERVNDAVYAVKAALSDGIVAGGGVVLKEVADELDLLYDKQAGKDKEILKLVIATLYAPFERIITNAGQKVDEVNELIALLPETVKNRGFDIVGRRAGDMFEMGINDPVKVTKLAIRYAFSVAGTALTTETLVTDDPEQDRNVQRVKAV